MNFQALTDAHPHPAMARDTFLDAMSRTVAGVAVVTTNGLYGQCGLTVSSMVSVSAEPPSLLFCVNRRSPAHDPIRDNGRCGINVLAAHQQATANAFAGRGDPARRYRFAAEAWADVDHIPRLRNASAFFDCTLDSCVEVGSHTIFVARVVRSLACTDTPLLYSGRNYGRPEALN